MDSALENPDGEPLDIDVLIIGAGPVGMTLALALADGGQRVHLLDRRPRGVWANDPRGWRSRTAAGSCSNAWARGTQPPAHRSRKSTYRSAAASAVR